MEGNITLHFNGENEMLMPNISQVKKEKSFQISIIFYTNMSALATDT